MNHFLSPRLSMTHHRWIISFKPTREHQKLVFTAVASYNNQNSESKFKLLSAWWSRVNGCIVEGTIFLCEINNFIYACPLLMLKANRDGQPFRNPQNHNTSSIERELKVPMKKRRLASKPISKDESNSKFKMSQRFFCFFHPFKLTLGQPTLSKDT